MLFFQGKGRTLRITGNYKRNPVRCFGNTNQADKDVRAHYD